ncbi:MAG TPA: ChaN family lipoprotein [Nitrospira sp.]|nr:ChaN family lipoprotein [Nitrospira sp.]
MRHTCDRSVTVIFRYVVAAMLLGAAACTGAGTTASPHPASTAVSDFREGQIIDTATNENISLDQLLAKLLDQEVIYLGEEHHNRFHVDAAVLLLQRLSAAGRRPTLAMEMFGWDGQTVIDRYLSSTDATSQDFAGQVQWQQSWGGPFEDYEPLVRFAKEHRLRLIALNPPKTLVRTVARMGLTRARQDPELSQWGMQDEVIVDDPVYRNRIVQQLRACHDGGSDAMYQTMYEASMVRDEGMAKIITSEVRRIRTEDHSSSGPVVSYTGGGHVQLNLPVPKRVARRLDNRIRQISIYMTSFESERMDDVRGMIAEKIGDYVWLTRVGAQGPPRRCR